jgi:probable HAF family extracellular repeat protein
MNKWFVSLTAISLSLLTSIPAWAITYNVTDLGTLPGGTISTANAINASGQIVGSSDGPDTPPHAVLWSEGTITDLGTYGGNSSEASAINASGQIVGTIYTYVVVADVGNAFSYSGSTMNVLGDWSNATGINDSGQIVGHYQYQSGAFIWNGAQINPQITPLQGDPTAINASGQIVGNNGNHAAILHIGGPPTDLGTLGGTSSWAWGINDSGQVVGQADTTGDVATHAFLYDGLGMHDLGTLGEPRSIAKGINAIGQVVGGAAITINGNHGEHAYLYSGSMMIDLNTLINPLSGWTLQEARGINDAGQIVGDGNNGSGTRAFLITPIPKWKGGTSSNPTSWDLTANWNTIDGAIKGAGLYVGFGNQDIANSVVDLGTSGKTVAGITFYSATSTTIQSTGGFALTLDNNGRVSTIDVAGTHTISALVVLNNDATISGTGTLNLSGGITGSHVLEVDNNLTATSIQVDTLTIGSGATVTIQAIPGGPLALSDNLSSVPEPSTVILLGIGAISLLAYAWRRRQMA